MAVVRFSEELKTNIVDNAKTLFNSRITKATEQVPDVGDLVYHRLLGHLEPLFEQLPKEFLSWGQAFDLAAIGTTRYGVRLKLSKPRVMPKDSVKLSNGRISAVYVADVHLTDSEEWADIKAQFDARKQAIDTLVSERDEFVKGVKALLDSHATLAPALKAWPPLWDLVPEKFKERHRKVVERTAPEERTAPDVDLTKLTSTVVAAKFTK